MPSKGSDTFYRGLLGLIGATVLAYWPAFFSGFVSFDDPQYVSQNGHVLAGLSSVGWSYAWTSFDCTNWHPLTWLSLQMDGSAWHANPMGYHVTNVILHCVNTALLFVAFTSATRSRARSLLVAALFALHPLHVESVAWISERKDVLCTLFLLLTIIAYVRYADRPSLTRYAGMVVLYALGLLAKPMLVTAPVLLLLFDIWPLQRLHRQGDVADTAIPQFPFRFLLLEKIPLCLLALFDGLMTLAAQKNAVAWLHGLPVPTRIANAFHAYLWYLDKTFLPTNLAVFYPHPEQQLSSVMVGLGILVLLGVSVFAIGIRRANPAVLFGWTWFVVSLLPVIGLLQAGGQAYADRYAYIPHIGLFVALVWGIDSLTPQFPIWKAIVGCLAIASLVICAALTYRQAGYWHDSETLWRHAIDVVPGNYVACFHLADARQSAGDYEEALRLLTEAQKTRRGAESANARFNRGRCLMALDRPAEAEQEFREARARDETNTQYLDELAKLLRKQGRDAEAAEVSRRSAGLLAERVRSGQGDATALSKFGLALAREGKLQEAIPYFQKSIEMAPSASSYNNLGLALDQLNRRREATQQFRLALQLDPNLAMAHFNLAKCLETDRDYAGARKHYGEAFRLNPGDEEAAQSLERLKGR